MLRNFIDFACYSVQLALTGLLDCVKALLCKLCPKLRCFWNLHTEADCELPEHHHGAHRCKRCGKYFHL